jgi:tRNA(Arg) A34 adenosine deaminase TadA
VTRSYVEVQIFALATLRMNSRLHAQFRRLILYARIHGEISAINACTAVFQARNMTATQIFAAWAGLSICKIFNPLASIPLTHRPDTNAESCPMCASAIRWSGFKEYIYGTTIQHNYNVGWGVITMSSYDVFQQTRQLPGYQTVMLTRRIPCSAGSIMRVIHARTDA